MRPASAPSPVVTSVPSGMSLPTVASIFADLTDRYHLVPRDSQIKLAEIVRNVLGAGEIACIEAPTGTGKTLGYLAGALDQYAHAGTQIPIVIATATVGLQEQIMRYDIPNLDAIGVLSKNRVAIAKGRGRYFCPRTTAVLSDKKLQDTQQDLFDSEKPVAEGGTDIALTMLQAWQDGKWNGEQDSWQGKLPECWQSTCAANSDTCVTRSCEFYTTCPYMTSRMKLATAQVIIANHDLVLADLAQRAEDQMNTVLPPKRYALIFDEAHNLPDKAVSTQEATAKLDNREWLEDFKVYGESVLATPNVAHVLSKIPNYSINVFNAEVDNLLEYLAMTTTWLTENGKFSLGGTLSWGLNVPEDALTTLVSRLASQAMQLETVLKVAAKAFAELAESETGVAKSFAIRMLARTQRFARLSKILYTGTYRFSSNEKLVRWVHRDKKGQLTLHSQPIEGAEVLTRLLWGTGFPIVMVSATLQIAGSFDRFASKSGLPARALKKALPPVFDYSRGFLHQPHMQAAPGDEGYETELVNKLQLLHSKNVAPGMLILFTADATMKRVVNALDSELKARVLWPGQGRSVPELIASHKERIERGERSVLIGLDSMTEGLDLPAAYCGHVVITRLPFAVPGDPVEEARREVLGQAWFEQSYLADMLTMLIQAAGRLIRREEDHGVITILDKRLYTKRYAGIAMNALPRFTFGGPGGRIQDYLDLADKRGFDKTHGQAKLRPQPKLTVVAPLDEEALEEQKEAHLQRKLGVAALTGVAQPATPGMPELKTATIVKIVKN